jgi:hypothetical protein
MAIIVEDGTGTNPAANSYVSVTDLTDFATLRGITFTGDEEVLLINAMDYVEAVRDDFKGSKTSSTQPLQWPREGVWIDNYAIDSDVIPQELKNAQMQAAIETDSQDLSPNTGQNIKSEKVDVLEVVYQDGDGSLTAPNFPKVDAYLDPISKTSSGMITLGQIR